MADTAKKRIGESLAMGSIQTAFKMPGRAHIPCVGQDARFDGMWNIQRRNVCSHNTTYIAKTGHKEAFVGESSRALAQQSRLIGALRSPRPGARPFAGTSGQRGGRAPAASAPGG